MSRPGRFRSGLSAEAAGPELIGADRPEEVDLAEGRPVGLAEVVLAVDALPGQEAGQANLAGGPDDEIGVARALGVEMRRQVLGGQRVGQVLRRDSRAIASRTVDRNASRSSSRPE